MLVHYVMCVAHDVCVVLGSSSMCFLVSLLLCDSGRKVIIIILSQHRVVCCA